MRAGCGRPRRLPTLAGPGIRPARSRERTVMPLRAAPSAPAAAPRAPALALLVLVLVACLLAGCTGAPGGGGPTAGASGVRATGAAATTTRGAELHAALTYLLTERVHLVLAHARAVQAAGGDTDDDAVAAARDAVEASSAATVDVLAASYSEATELLLPALRAYDAALLDVTTALAAGDEAAAEASGARLDERQQALAEAVRQVVPRLRIEDLDTGLALATAATVEAVRAAVEGSPRAPGLQRLAHQAAWDTARQLAVGVSTDRGLGAAGSPAGDLRGRLTGLLTEQVLLSVSLAARFDAVDGDPADPLAQAITAAMDANAASLADLAGRAAPEVALPVLQAWRDHQREVREYAAARAAGRPLPPAPRAATELLSQALEPQVGSLPLGSTDGGAQAAASLHTALDTAATGSSRAPSASRQATADTPAVAALLAAGLAEALQLP